MSKLVKSLSRGVVAVFTRLGVPAEELLNGPLKFTDLTWQVPPIVCDEKLDGVPFWEYLDVGLSVKEEEFYSFYHETMLLLRNETHIVLDSKGYKNSAAGLRCPKTEKEYWLPVPEGYPGNLTDTAGAVFSMECAHVLKLGGLVSRLVETDNDYWVLTKGGYEVGVRNGLPLVNPEEWDADVSGLVPDLLRIPRGNPFTGCDYDLVSKLRSFLWEQKDRVSRDDFTSADYALQTLRIIGAFAVSPMMQQLVRSLKHVPVKSERKAGVLLDALALLDSVTISDRQKLLGLRDMIVPEIMAKSAYSKAMYSYNRQPPAMVADSVIDRCRVNVQILLDKENSNYAVKT